MIPGGPGAHVRGDRYPRAVPAPRKARARAVPPRPVRVGEQVLYKLAHRLGEQTLADRLLADELAGVALVGPAPRLLVRVDEFPHYLAWDEPERFGARRYERFHEIMAAAGARYLVAVLPRVSHSPLSPAGAEPGGEPGAESRALEDEEIALLGRLAREGVGLALHGLNHRTREASPRRHSELCGLDRPQTRALLDQALAELARHNVHPEVFVPPFNRFDARQFEWLAERFAVICGGPESIGTMGLQRTPRWRGHSVYMPAYAPYYGRAGDLLRALPHVLGRAQGAPRLIPVVLHWGWEADREWSELERLAELIAPHTASWREFLEAVTHARETATEGAAASGGSVSGTETGARGTGARA